MNITVDAAAVEKAVTDAVVASAIGAKIQLAVTNLLARNYENPIEKAVEKVIAETALDVIRNEYAEPIREAVKKTLAETTIDKFTELLWDRVLKFNVKSGDY